MAESQTRSRAARTLGAAVLILVGLAAYGVVSFNTLRYGRTTFEEVGYLIRSWWYAASTLTPYSGSDATWNMPLYYYLLGWWQQVVGVGHHEGRILSIALGLIAAGFLFACCRRLTGNVLASAAGVLVFLATPTVAYAFSMATPVALVAALHMAAIWLLVTSLGRPRAWATILFGLLCVAIFFTKQNLLPGLLVLMVLYVAAIGRERGGHAVTMLATIALVSLLVMLAFPERMTANAIRLPLIGPYLSRWGVLPPDFGLIHQGTTGAVPLLPDFAPARWAELIDTLLLPFAGTIVLAATVFVVAGKSLRVLWLAPLYFFGLIAVHVTASAVYCNGCMLSYTPSFAAVGALAAALGLAALASIARRNDVNPALIIVVGGLFGAVANIFAPILARDETYRYFPAPRFAQTQPELETDDIDMLSRWLKATAPAQEPILLLHDDPALAYAVFLSGAVFPVQSIDPEGTKRTVRPRIVGAAREAVQAAVEAQSLWTDDTLKRWLARDYELVLFAQPNDREPSPLIAELDQKFDVAATQPFRGQMLTLYRRKALQ